MQGTESNQPQYRRRATDFTEAGMAPTALDAWHGLHDHHRRLTDLEQGQAELRKAFIKNDLGEPDIEGHRAAHIEAKEASKVVSSYKLDTTKKIIWVVIAGAGYLIARGALEWLRLHIV